MQQTDNGQNGNGPTAAFDRLPPARYGFSRSGIESAARTLEAGGTLADGTRKLWDAYADLATILATPALAEAFDRAARGQWGNLDALADAGKPKWHELLDLARRVKAATEPPPPPPRDRRAEKLAALTPLAEQIAEGYGVKIEPDRTSSGRLFFFRPTPKQLERWVPGDVSTRPLAYREAAAAEAEWETVLADYQEPS